MMLSVDQRSNYPASAVATLSNQHIPACYDTNPPQILKRNPASSQSNSHQPDSTYHLTKKDRVASLTQELASLQDDEELGGQVAQLVAALNTRSARKPSEKASTRYEAAQATRHAVPVVEIPSSRPVPGPATSGKSDFAIIGLGLQKIPTNSSQ